MSHRKSTANTLRRIFVFLECLSLVGLVFTLGVLFFFLTQSGGDMGKSYSLGEVQIEIPEESYLLESDQVKGESIFLDKVRGQIDVKNPEDLNGYLSSMFWYTAPVIFIYWGGLFVVSELLRRLFKNVHDGNSFTEGNVRIFHKLGVTIIVFSILSSLGLSLIKFTSAKFLEENVDASGVEISYDVNDYTPGFGVYVEDVLVRFTVSELKIYGGKFGLDIPLFWILAGLLLIGIGEAFRQGLLLKKENELTV